MVVRNVGSESLLKMSHFKFYFFNFWKWVISNVLWVLRVLYFFPSRFEQNLGFWLGFCGFCIWNTKVKKYKKNCIQNPVLRTANTKIILHFVYCILYFLGSAYIYIGFWFCILYFQNPGQKRFWTWVLWLLWYKYHRVLNVVGFFEALKIFR